MNKFTKWIQWKDKDSIVDLKYPGVYCLKISGEDLSGNEIDWTSDLQYIGMSNSKAGMKGRLKQFDNSINDRHGHGGALRFKTNYENYNQLVEKLDVSVRIFKCDVTSNKPVDLRKMGQIAEFEYICIAKYIENHGDYPEFSNKRINGKPIKKYKL